jgi:hypothetical protein
LCFRRFWKMHANRFVLRKIEMTEWATAGSVSQFAWHYPPQVPNRLVA